MFITKYAKLYIYKIFKKFKKIKKKKELRIKVIKYGCKGLSFKIIFNKKYYNDIYIKINNIIIFIEKKNILYIKNLKIDYIKSNLIKKIVFINSDIISYCGCGNSFLF